MRIEKQLITVEFAEQLLLTNIKNRAISKFTVDKYASDIIKGNWMQDTGELIKVSKNGKLLDGQHRLRAIIKADMPVSMHIAYGLEEDIFKTIDSGKKRNPSDVFRINDIHYSCRLPGAIKTYIVLKMGYQNSESSSSNTTTSDLLNTYYERTDFWNWNATNSDRLYQAFSCIITPSTISGMHALFYDLSPEMAADFMEQLCTGQNVKNNVIMLLRKKLTDDKLSVKKVTISIKNGWIIKTWNYYRKGKQVKRIILDTSYEEFPKPI